MRTNEKHIPQGSDIGGKKGGFLQGGAGSTWWRGDGRKENDAPERGWPGEDKRGAEEGGGLPSSTGLNWMEQIRGPKRDSAHLLVGGWGGSRANPCRSLNRWV